MNSPRKWNLGDIGLVQEQFNVNFKTFLKFSACSFVKVLPDVHFLLNSGPAAHHSKISPWEK